MRAIRIDAHGAADVLRLVEIPMPPVAFDQVLVRNHAIGVNYVDVQHRAGGYYPVTLPLIPGIEAAGIIAQVGDAVQGFGVGERVCYAGYMGGNYAEYTPVPQDQLIAVPDALTFEDAAAGIMQGMTAHCLTHDVYSVREGDWVLVHAAAGGVGAMLVQYAKLRGARVIATVSSAEKAQFVAALGADHIINYREQAFDAVSDARTQGRGVDVVYDALGKPTFDASLRALKRCGHMVVYGQTGGAVPLFDVNRLSGLTDASTRGSITLTWAALSHYNADTATMRARAATLFAHMLAKQITPHISQRLPLAHAADAHRLLEARTVHGKVVLVV
jgi:NADPH:quinone reductase